MRDAALTGSSIGQEDGRMKKHHSQRIRSSIAKKLSVNINGMPRFFHGPSIHPGRFASWGFR